MKNYSKKLQELKKEREEIFMEIFPFGKKKDDDSEEKKDFFVSNEFYEVKSNESVVFKKNGSKADSVFPNFTSLHHILENKQLQWIFDEKVNFKCRKLAVTEKGISILRGEWNGGNFLGYEMYEVIFNKGFFNGGLFEGDNSKWNAHPYYFINGKWGVDGNILGINDIYNTSQKTFKFNIISIVPGNKISIKTSGGKNYEIHVLKRLDKKNSLFKYKIKHPNSDDLKPVEVSWGFMRGKNESEFDKRTIFKNSSVPSLFEEMFGIKINPSDIIGVSVMSSNEVDKSIEPPKEEKTSEELSKTQQYYDLSNAPFIGISKLDGEYYNEKGILVKNNVGRVYFNAPNSDVLNNFENVVKNLNNKTLWSDFRQLKSWLDAKAINGAPENYLWLADLIGKDTTKRKIDDKNFLDSLNRIEAFLRYFVDIIVKYAGKAKKIKGQTDTPNDEIKELIKNNLRKYLGIDSQEEKKQNIAPQKNPKPQKKSKIIKENVVLSIKKIISNNLKQF